MTILDDALAQGNKSEQTSFCCSFGDKKGKLFNFDLVKGTNMMQQNEPHQFVPFVIEAAQAGKSLQCKLFESCQLDLISDR